MNEFGKIFCTSQLAQLDEYTIEKDGVTSLELMEGAAVVFTRKLLEFFPKTRFFAVVAGPGNNGGDGFACARFLMDAGKNVKVYDVAPGKDGSVARETCRQRYLEAGGRIVEVRRAGELRLGEGQVVVDALFGAGLNRPVKGVYAEVVETMNESGLPIVALDMPSGLMGEDNGENDGAIVNAVRTITFQFPKLALMFADNYPHVGEWTVVDIGLNPDVLSETASRYYFLDRDRVAMRLRTPGKFAHKGTEGHTLLIVGSEKMQGAAVLATGGALRSGAGLVSVLLNFSNDSVFRMKMPEVLLRSPLAWNFEERITDKYQSVAIGPGFDTTALSEERMWRILKEGYTGKMVLDADALNLLSTHPEWWTHIPKEAVLTPHPKEFERLAGKSRNNFERLNKLSTFAQEHDVVMVLKGAHTVIASPDGRCFFNTSGTPGMAKGGSGDVLTGIIAALLASGHEPLDAAIVGVFAHGLAGEKAAGRYGVRGMKAGDVAEALGETWKELESCKNKDLCL